MSSIKTEKKSYQSGHAYFWLTALSVLLIAPVSTEWFKDGWPELAENVPASLKLLIGLSFVSFLFFGLLGLETEDADVGTLARNLPPNALPKWRQATRVMGRLLFGVGLYFCGLVGFFGYFISLFQMFGSNWSFSFGVSGLISSLTLFSAWQYLVFGTGRVSQPNAYRVLCRHCYCYSTLVGIASLVVALDAQLLLVRNVVFAMACFVPLAVLILLAITNAEIAAEERLRETASAKQKSCSTRPRRRTAGGDGCSHVDSPVAASVFAAVLERRSKGNLNG